MIDYDMCPICKGSKIPGVPSPCTCESTVVLKVDSASDPTLYHCQHEIGKINNYPYCPYCGEMI